MLRLRLFLAWLLLVAVPLQGFAAASALLCGPGERARMAAQASAGHGGPMGHATIDARHAHEDHAQSSHAGGPHAHFAQADAAGAPHAMHHPGAGHDEASAPSADDKHSCLACAASCHAVALTGDPDPVALPVPPNAPSAEPFVHFDSRPPPVPDKPPRA